MTILFGGKPTEAELFSIGSPGVTSAKSINGNSYFFGHNRSFFAPRYNSQMEWPSVRSSNCDERRLPAARRTPCD
jgi:hypothetical protein